VQLLGEASVLVDQDKSLEEVVDVFDEPAERDIAMAAIRGAGRVRRHRPRGARSARSRSASASRLGKRT
jgi:hypothetical protein